jgi:ankyrin repeat protein
MSLIVSTRLNDLETLKALIAKGVDVNTVDEYGHTALWYAAHEGNVECSTALLDANADADKADNEGYTPLHQASHFGWVECVQILVRRKANVNALNNYGSLPLHLASMRDLACVRILADFITEMDGLRNYRGRTPLACALICNCPDIAEFLLHSGAKMKNVHREIIPDWIHEIVANLNTAMYSTLVVKALLRRRLGLSKDVTNLLGFYFWNLRVVKKIDFQKRV